MSLSQAEKTLILAFWNKASGLINTIGPQIVNRLLLAYPQLKTHFGNFNVTPGSSDLNTLGIKIITAVGGATQHMDDLPVHLAILTDLHSLTLRIDPGNYKLMIDCIVISMAASLPQDFTAEVQNAMTNFLIIIGDILASKFC
ncbi:hemoglobin subunit alpha-3 [Xenopus laevis]|uniref:Hemoglobin subunit alpha-3 n=2 Tax=Xenopus laevis TaxID=8355 RepID=A0A1L8EXG7_XENLA|nr:hemoglobin subunit alpha-3 [Xenopus laevis]OCT63995.1 hypothetical protein XELAEV_18045093mg [Xenopus laevis]